MRERLAAPLKRTDVDVLAGADVRQATDVMDANWDLFRLFFAVARCGSVNRAAHELGMSQPTLSRRLKELERHVGAPLFFRASSGVQLTPEGEDSRRSAADMMAAFESFQRDINSRIGRRSSVVRISATEGLTKHWLLPRVRKLHESNNRVHLEITSTVTQESLVKRDLDFVIRMGDPGESELIGKRVATVRFGIFASEKYLSTRPAPRTMADLRDHDIIGIDTEASPIKSPDLKFFTDYIEAADLRCFVRVTPLINHFAAAVEGLGLAYLAIPFARAEGLVQVLPAETGSVGVWVLRRRESDLRKLTRDVRRFLESEFSRSKAWLAGG